MARFEALAPVVIDVLEPNWIAVNVYMRCQQTVTSLSSMQSARTMYHGISAAEAEAAMRAMAVPRARRGETLAQVQSMGSIAANVLNERSARR